MIYPFYHKKKKEEFFQMHACPMEKLNGYFNASATVSHQPLFEVYLSIHACVLLADWQVIVKSQVTSSFSAFAGDTFS